MSDFALPDNVKEVISRLPVKDQGEHTIEHLKNLWLFLSINIKLYVLYNRLEWDETTPTSAASHVGDRSSLFPTCPQKNSCLASLHRWPSRSA